MYIPDFFCTFAPVFVRLHHKGAHTYILEQINYDERKAGRGADIIAKGWEENHWARPTIKDSYFPSEETELIWDLLKEGDQGTTQTTTQKSDQKRDQKIIMAIKENPKITRAELQNITGLSESGVKKIRRQLQQKGILSRIGPDKGGHWEIIEK